jgi:hypothetical protein
MDRLRRNRLNVFLFLGALLALGIAAGASFSGTVKMDVTTKQGILGPLQVGFHSLWGDDARQAPPPVQEAQSPVTVKIVHSDIEPNAEELSLMKSMREVLRKCQEVQLNQGFQMNQYSQDGRQYHVEPIPEIYMVHRHFTADEKRKIRSYIATLPASCQKY